MATSVKAFRQSFQISKERITWYPGHMDQSFKKMQATIRKVDCILEIHDARIPFSGRNPRFLSNLIGSKPHVLVLNKKDLIDSSYHKVIRQRCLEENCENVIFTNCMDKRCKSLQEVIPLTVKLIKGEGIYPRINSYLKVMVIGVPNVGKSSLINALRNIVLAKGKATRVGPQAGVTKSVQNEIKVNSDPPLYLIDTPGILPPSIQDHETGMKLALCSCLNDSIIGLITIADFLLYWMNKTNNFLYVNHFELKEPVDDIFLLLLKIAVDNNLMKRTRNLEKNIIETIPNIHAAAERLVSHFRKGNFGDLCLDKNYL